MNAQKPDAARKHRSRRRHYFISYIEWRGDYATGRGYEAGHGFDADTDAEARQIADKHMRGVKTSGPVVLSVTERRIVPWKRAA